MARNNNSKFAVRPKNVDPKYDLWADNKPILPRDYYDSSRPAPTPTTDAVPDKQIIMIKGNLKTNIQWLNAPGKVMKIDKNNMPLLGIKFIDRRTSPIPYRNVLDVFNKLECKLELKMNKAERRMQASCRIYAIDEDTNEEFDIAVFTAMQPYYFKSKD